MAKRRRDIITELTDVLAEGTKPSGDYFEKVIDATAGHDRLLVGLYALLAVAVVFLLFQVEMSHWAGAALVTSWALFAVGLAHTSMHIVSYHKMLLLADAVRHGEETVDLEGDQEEVTPEAFVRAEATARSLHSSETHYLFLGLLCAGIAVVIDHWQYAWRASAVLAGAVILLLVSGFVPRIIRAMTGRPRASIDEDAQA